MFVWCIETESSERLQHRPTLYSNNIETPQRYCKIMSHLQPNCLECQFWIKWWLSNWGLPKYKRLFVFGYERQWLDTKLDSATMTFANMIYCCFSQTSKEWPTYMNGYERYECLISSINWPAMDWRLLMWLVMSLGI